MDWQLAAVTLAVAAAAGYVVRRAWRAWFAAKSGCGGGCGCAAKKPAPDGGRLIAPEQLTLRRRDQSHT